MGLGKSVKHRQKWNFQLEVDGFNSALWSKVDGFEGEIDVIEYSAGSSVAPEKAPGRVKFSNLVCERGVGVDEDAYLWFQDVVDVAAGVGSDEPYRQVDLVELLRSKTEGQRTTFHEAFPTKYKGGEWDGDASEVTIEMLELAYFHPEKQILD